MAARRPAQGRNRKRKDRQDTETEAPALADPRQPRGERSFVDVDPWAMLLEQVMEMPKEAEESQAKPPERK